MNRGRGERTLKRLDDLTRHEGQTLETQDQLPRAVLTAADQMATGTSRSLGQCEEESLMGSQRSLPVRNTSDGDSTYGLPQILTVEEAAAFLRLNVKTVHAAITAGEMPGRKVRRRTVILRDALLEWLRSKPRVTARRKRSR